MQNIIFTKEECDYIKSFYNKDTALDGNKPLVVNLPNNETISIKRNASAHYIDCYNKSLISFILKKLNILNIKSITKQAVKIVKYSKGDYFKKHTDFTKYANDVIVKTLVIQLSNPNSYIGGDLIVKDKPQNRDLGSYSLFSSSDIHEVTEVIDGERFSLTIFLTEKDFYQTTTLI